MTETLHGLTLGANDALFFDFDGTLAELGPDADAIALDPDAGRDLVRIARKLDGAVVLISGRDIRDLAGRTPDAVWHAGGHGLEIRAPGDAVPDMPQPPPDAVLTPLRRVEADNPGVRLELKGPVAALHFRAAPGAETACHDAARAAAEAAADHVWQAGKMVVEVKPAGTHKGEALRRMMRDAPFAGRRPIMFGDDTTDEDAIVVAQELGGLGVKVGEGASAAQIRADDPVAVRAWLAAVAR